MMNQQEGLAARVTGVSRDNIRNIAIIAHVDHGKTTLVDKLFRHAGALKDETVERLMDSNDLEKERGITILAKNTGITYQGYRINIVDTPGHSDFGGEVERTLQMVEGFLLLVDAAEGVLPGTRFVLRKALELNLRPIVVINKIDRKDADIARVESQVHDLFLDLAVKEDQLEFPVLYGSSRIGFMTTNPEERSGTMDPLFQAILNNIPAPVERSSQGLQLLVTNLDHSDFLGLIAVGRVFSGSIKVGQQFICCKDDTISQPMRVTKLFAFEGLQKVEIEQASYGDIVAVTGFSRDITIGTTLCHVGMPLPYSYVKVDEPTVSMYFSVNDSPFNGRDGKFLTSRHLKERLEKELRTNVALRVLPTDSPESFKVLGRGQLHLGILVETMRREGFELQLSAPEVIYKTIDGIKQEPMEYLTVDIQEEHQGVIMERLGRKKAEMKNVVHFGNDRIRLEFEVPSRGLFGFRSQFLTDTRGTGIATFSFLGYQPFKGEIPVRTKGALVSMEKGKVTGFALDNLQERGILFVSPGVEVYEGMIIGENSREGDMDVNPCKEKKLTNMRASGTDEAIKLEPPRVMDLETCMEWIAPDELIEVTPNHIRLRKKILRAALRK
jgi:GTP-binding protein